MPRFYQPDLAVNIDNPFMRDANDKLVRRSYWLDMNDHTLVGGDTGLAKGYCCFSTSLVIVI
jgi:hypothetical protein